MIERHLRHADECTSKVDEPSQGTLLWQQRADRTHVAHGAFVQPTIATTITRVWSCIDVLVRLTESRFRVADHTIDIELPVFKHLTHFAISSDGGNSSSVYTFLAQSRDILRSLSINNPRWRFPSEAISVRHLTQIEFNGCFSTDTQAFSEILANGHQLESLMLSGTLECTPSSLFRQYRTGLPFLRHFSLTITSLHRHIADRELCPAISEFLRDRTQLRTYHLLVPPTDARRIGFDASAWGVLPVLSKLSSLSITYPRDLSPALAGWLVPRTVRALTLDLSPAVTEDLMAFMNVRPFPCLFFLV